MDRRWLSPSRANAAALYWCAGYICLFQLKAKLWKEQCGLQWLRFLRVCHIFTDVSVQEKQWRTEECFCLVRDPTVVLKIYFLTLFENTALAVLRVPAKTAGSSEAELERTLCRALLEQWCSASIHWKSHPSRAVTPKPSLYPSPPLCTQSSDFPRCFSPDSTALSGSGKNRVFCWGNRGVMPALAHL